MDTIKTDIAVIGGGASGLASALSALDTFSCSVTVAEKLDRVGKKILSTGNGRCNLSNRTLSENCYSGSVKNMMRIIGKCSDTEDFFNGMGLLCVSDSEGRVYPRSNSAASVLDALRIRLDMLGGTELCGFDVTDIEITGNGFTLSSDSGSINCRKLIIAAGGYAAPSLGTDGSVMRLLKKMGYKTSKIFPAVAPLRADSQELKGLKGVRAKGRVKAIADGRCIHEESGEIQFTDNFLSGICIFNMARYMAEYEGRLTIEIDLCPGMKAAKLEEFICMAQAMRYDCSLEDLLTGILTKKLAVYIIKKALGRPLSDAVSSIGYPEIKAIVRQIKSLCFKITGASPWQNAQATAGGIHGSCVDENLQSKLHKGIYLCGEILDVVGDCGGFNLQWAWSSGILAGRSCALSLRQKERQ